MMISKSNNQGTIHIIGAESDQNFLLFQEIDNEICDNQETYFLSLDI